MSEEIVSRTSSTKKYQGPEDIYDELVSDKDTSWLLGLVAFAVVEEQKVEWIKHHSIHNGSSPSADQIRQWYEQLPPGAVLRAKGTAENALQVYSSEVLEEVSEEIRKEIQSSSLVSEIRDLKRFWPQFGVNLAGGFISSLLFALLLVSLAIILIKSPSPGDFAREFSSQQEAHDHDSK